MRALRVDKMTYAALEATLGEHLRRPRDRDDPGAAHDRADASNAIERAGDGTRRAPGRAPACPPA